MKTGDAVYYYYHSDEGLRLNEFLAYPGNGGNWVTQRLTDPLRHDYTEDIDSDHVDAAMNEASRNLRVIEHDGSFFEVSVTNGSLPNNKLSLHVSTYSSSLSTNPGNLYEFAAQAVRYPEIKHLYVASFGMGSTSPLLKEDAAYAALCGRYTTGLPWEAKPIKSIENLHGALKEHKWDATRLMGTDSAGGHVARALAVAMEPGQLDYAFFSESSGFVDMSSMRIISGILIKEGRKNARANKSLSPDKEMMDERKIERAKAALRRYESAFTRRELVANKVALPTRLVSMKDSMDTLKRGPINGADPMAAETEAMLFRHPKARVTYGLAENDPLYLSPEKCHEAVGNFLGKVAVHSSPLRALIIPGMTHAYNTYFPSLYHAINKDALNLG